MTALFFAWGFVCANNDPLIAAVRRTFDLSYTEALLTQIVFFIAFATVSMPAAALLGRLGAVRTILAALAAMVAGCLVIQGSRWVAEFAVVLGGLFLIAAGVTTLQVAANPLAAALGPPERSHFRLTLAHSFNSLGVVAGVHFGAQIILAERIFRSTEPLETAAQRAFGIAAVAHAFLIIGALVLCLALLIFLTRHTIARADTQSAETPGHPLAALRSRWALFGAVAIGLYVGAEVSIGSVLILYLAAPGTLNLPLADAGAMVANLYWGGALVGRFAGTWLLMRIAAPTLLVGAAATAVALCIAGLVLPGPIGAWCLLVIGLFNSIMFPTIFALTLERSTAPRASTSGLVCLAIGGGAVLPLLTGAIADRAGLGMTFFAPMLGYMFVAGFAFACTLGGTRRETVHPVR